MFDNPDNLQVSENKDPNSLRTFTWSIKWWRIWHAITLLGQLQSKKRKAKETSSITQVVYACSLPYGD